MIQGMRKYGLLGRSLQHSYSPAWFQRYFQQHHITDAHYGLFALSDMSGFADWLSQEQHLKGFNVTIPYKREVIPFLDMLSPQAYRVGAVNCVSLVTDENVGALDGYHRQSSMHGLDGVYLIGHNTDAPALHGCLVSARQEDPWRRGLIMGIGGGALSAAYVLQTMGITFDLVGRSEDSFQKVLKDFAHASATSMEDMNKRFWEFGSWTAQQMEQVDVFIQATPVGMYPNVNDTLPLPYEHIKEKSFLYDMVYNPAQTSTMSIFLQRGARVSNGVGMLHQQAALSAAFWGF
jgi:shikimate dehydrogenase